MKRWEELGALARRSLAASLAFLVAGCAYAQICDVELLGSTDLQREPRYGHFLSSASINGSSPVPLIVDTGAHKTFVEEQLATDLALPERSGRRRRMTSTDGTKGRAYADVTARELSFAGLAYSDFVLAVGAKLPGEGHAARGILGADLLSQYEVEFDFPGKRLNLYRARNCDKGDATLKPWPQPFNRVPLKVDGTTLSLRMVVDGMELELAVDTGAARTKLSLAAAAKLGLDIERLKTHASSSIGFGVNGVGRPSYAWTFERVGIGQSTYGNVELKISDIDVRPYDGLLGLDFLGSQKIWVSYATQQLLVERRPAVTDRELSRSR